MLTWMRPGLAQGPQNTSSHTRCAEELSTKTRRAVKLPLPQQDHAYTTLETMREIKGLGRHPSSGNVTDAHQLHFDLDEMRTGNGFIKYKLRHLVRPDTRGQCLA